MFSADLLFFYYSHGQIIQADAVELSVFKWSYASVDADLVMVDGIEPYVKLMVAVDIAERGMAENDSLFFYGRGQVEPFPYPCADLFILFI